jgi:hypothetical protein
MTTTETRQPAALSARAPLPTMRYPRELTIEPGRFHRLLQVIGRTAKFDEEQPLLTAQQLVLGWLAKKNWHLELHEALGDRPIQLEADDSLRALAIESAPNLWAVRMDDPCAKVAGRVWRVELVVMANADGDPPAFGCTLSVLVPPGTERTVRDPGVPAVIGTVSRELGLFESGRELDGRVWNVDRPADIGDLVRFIEAKSRSCAVLVISHSRHGPSFVQADRVASALAGVAVTVALSADAAPELTQRYGRELGVFGDAARMYRVGFDPDSDARLRHPLYLGTVWNGRQRDPINAVKFVAMQDTVVRRDAGRDLPSFGIIRQAAAQARLRAVLENRRESDEDHEELTNAIRTLTDESDTWKQMALDEERRAEEAIAAQQQTRARLIDYRARIVALEQKLAEQGREEEPEHPDSLRDLVDWATRYHAGRLVITPRAARAANAVDYQEVGLVYDCLTMLAREYWEKKVHGGAELHARCTQAEASLGVRIGPTGDAVSSRNFKHQYEVTWEGATYTLDLHVQGSDSRDIRRGLRIYFAWDEEQELVVVGHLPTHLTNSLS